MVLIAQWILIKGMDCYTGSALHINPSPAAEQEDAGLLTVYKNSGRFHLPFG